MKVGFIGLGKMGKPMAERLLNAGFQVAVHNRSRGVVEALAGKGATPATSPRGVAQLSDIVLTCLPSPDSVEAVYMGLEGLISSARPGQILIDHSTVSPITSRHIHAAAAEKGVYFLDAPISGGVPRAEAGTLTIMVGGEAEVLEKARPVLAVLGDRVVLAGPSGTGSVVKLVNQLLVGIHSAAAAEALVFGVKAGADPRVMLDVIGTSFGGSTMFSRTVPMAIARQFGTGTDIRILSKDMGLITDLGKKLSTRLLLGATTEQVIDEAVGLGLGYDDIAGLVQPVERIAGVEVR